MTECPTPELPHRLDSAPTSPSRRTATMEHPRTGEHLAGRQTVADGATETGPQPREAHGKQSDVEVVGVEEETADDTASSVGIDEPLPPLPPLSTFAKSATHDVGDATPSGPQAAVGHKVQPQAIRQSREFALPVRKASSSESARGKQARTPRAQPPKASRPMQVPSQQPGDSTNAKSRKTPSPRRGSPKDAEGSPKIHIPKIPSINPGISPPSNISALAAGLEGNYVDDFGNVLDWNGHVLGRVEGDLPSMVGRPVSASGEIASEDGQVVGYVVENDTIPAPQPLEGVAGRGLQVDHEGNILDGSGNVVGRLDGKPKLSSSRAPDEGRPEASSSHQHSTSSSSKETCSCGHKKPSSAPSPSEIYLDVKSTNDGIQLIIKIPTVFNRDQTSVRIES